MKKMKCKKIKWKKIIGKKITEVITGVLITGASLMILGGCNTSKDLSGAGKTENNSAETILTAFVQQSVASDDGIWEGWGAQKLYEDTNIKVDFYASGNEVEQKLKQYMAAGNLPDIIGFRDLDEVQLLMDADLLLPLEEYENLLPAIFKTEEYQSAIAYTMENTSNGTGKPVSYTHLTLPTNSLV